MNDHSPRVCISVLNWNSYPYTIRCIESLRKLDYTNYRIIVVDNASQDDSVAQIRAVFSDIEIIRAESNLGYAGGNELAFQQALVDGESELFWILNNDTIVDRQALTALVRAWEMHGDALYGGVSVQGEERFVRMPPLEFTFKRRLLHIHPANRVLYSTFFKTVQPRIVSKLRGNTFLIPLSVARQYGFIDVRFFLYGEDDDYCLRLARHGIQCMLVPESTIYHVEGGSGKTRQGLGKIMRYYSVRNRLILCRRYLGVLYWIYMIAVYLLMVLKQTLLPKADLPKGWQQYTLLGIRDGVLGRMGKTFAPEDWLD